jgi:hypothetical protein
MDQSIRGRLLHSAVSIFIEHHHIDNLSRQTAELFWMYSCDSGRMPV